MKSAFVICLSLLIIFVTSGFFIFQHSCSCTNTEQISVLIEANDCEHGIDIHQVVDHKSHSNACCSSHAEADQHAHHDDCCEDSKEFFQMKVEFDKPVIKQIKSFSILLNIINITSSDIEEATVADAITDDYHHKIKTQKAYLFFGQSKLDTDPFSC